MFVLLMGSADAGIQKWFGKFLYRSFIIRNHSHEILVGSNEWLLIDEWWFAIYSILASIYYTGMCAKPSCCACLTPSNFTMVWNQLLTVLAWVWFYCLMHFNCIYRTEVLQTDIYIFVLMLWCHWVTPQWTMYIISHLFLFVYIIPFYVYHVPMFSLLMYFVRNDKNKDD